MYTTARVGPMLDSAQAGLGLVHFLLLSGPDLNQKFHIIIAANASSICFTSRLTVQTTGNVQMMLSLAPPCYGAKRSAASLCLRKVKSNCSIPCPPPHHHLHLLGEMVSTLVNRQNENAAILKIWCVFFIPTVGSQLPCMFQ